jgi:hypothetical protein
MVGGPHFMRSSRGSFRAPTGDRFRRRALLEHHRQIPLLAVAFEEAPSRVPMHEGAPNPGAVAPTPTRGRGAFSFTAVLRRGGRPLRAGGRRLSWLAPTLAICVSMGGALLCAPLASAAAPQIEEEWVTEVSASSALLHATINAEKEPTTYKFEYATSESALLAGQGDVIPSPPAEGEAGEGEGVVEQIQAQDLQAGTVYYFRAVARNVHGEATDGEGSSFTTPTLPPGSELVLPDGRMWEQVSPEEKHGFQPLPAEGSVIQASENGGAITYTASGPFAGTPANIGVTQILSRRGPNGWSSQDISPPQAQPVLTGGVIPQSEYPLFSSDLDHGLVEPFGPTLLSPAATERTLYVRNNSTGEYEAVVSPANSGAQVGQSSSGGQRWPLAFVGATPDLSHVVVGSDVPLTGSEPASTSVNLYEWSDGGLQLVDELPADDSQLPAENNEISLGGEEFGNLRNAISDDGSRIFWELAAGGEPKVDGLYMRDVPGGETIKIAAAQGISEPPEGGRGEFQIASSDGSEVFFTSPQQLTAVPGEGLYVYDVESGELTLLTVTEHAGEAAEVEGTVLGASEDGSYIYLVARGILSENKNANGEEALAGANNLYVAHSETRGGLTEWKTSFIAGLSNEDEPDWAPFGAGHRQTDVSRLTARVSPNGRYLAFMSQRSLTGYDNIDAGSPLGEPRADEEVFLYDAQAGRLVCASCNPSGERPVGRVEASERFADIGYAWTTQWIAASIPSWLKSGFQEIGLYQPRYLSDSGRLFFDSPDTLVPQDTNGAENVYEYEPEGIGSCIGSSTTYSVSSAGCVSLISGGKGAQESAFLDASASGNDAFFVTSENLVPGDVDGAYDVYDAHVCGSEAPCPESGGVVTAPVCDTAESCKAPPSTQPAIFGAPASATFTGSGDITPYSNVITAKPNPNAKKPKIKKAARCAKGKRRRHGRCVRTKTGRRVGKAGKTSEDRRAGR